MAAKSSTYSFVNVSATLDGLPVVGGWDGDDAIVITPGVDVGTLLVGADGSSIFSQTADQSATISLKLQHTSGTHRQLLQKHAQQRAGRLIGFPLDIKEIQSGDGGTADQCFVQKAPAASMGKNASVREWILITGQWEPAIINA